MKYILKLLSTKLVGNKISSPQVLWIISSDTREFVKVMNNKRIIFKGFCKLKGKINKAAFYIIEKSIETTNKHRIQLHLDENLSTQVLLLESTFEIKARRESEDDQFLHYRSYLSTKKKFNK
eukprot:snap_masked-scaffold_2-processed-gene-11.15-mRNA-1 protein AED:1.00 eAED:1.00 QI:0/0/0/0/1/1/2/0/121